MARYQARPSLFRRRPILLQSLLLATIFLLIFRYPGVEFEIRLPSVTVPQCFHHHKSPPPKYAYATLLLPSPNDDPNNPSRTISSSSDLDSDPFFTSTLLLAYQLLHAPKTRTKHSYPFLVLVDPNLPATKRDLLTLVGATLIEAEPIIKGQDWIKPLVPHWAQLTAKLHLFEQDAWERILFLDADTFLLGNLDGVFTDPGARKTPIRRATPRKLDEAPLPFDYVFASVGEMLHVSHPWPPLPWPRFNAGFFLLKPSRQLFNYYVTLLGVEGKFDGRYVEQALLNYAHREEGNMPWGKMWHGWNVVLPNWGDVKGGVRSVHAKLWAEGTELKPVDERLRGMWRKRKGEMVGWLERRGGELTRMREAEREREREEERGREAVHEALMVHEVLLG